MSSEELRRTLCQITIKVNVQYFLDFRQNKISLTKFILTEDHLKNENAAEDPVSEDPRRITRRWKTPGT